MRLALDFDDTYTRDPELWDKFIEWAKERGHEVICVTMRYPYEIELDRHQFPKGVEIYATSRSAKYLYLLNKGIHVDVWIDDDPMWLYRNG